MSAIFDVDTKRDVAFTVENSVIKQYQYDPQMENEPEDMMYINQVPIVTTWKGKSISPDNLRLYNGGCNMLLTDRNNMYTVANLDIEHGIITNSAQIKTDFTGGRKDESVQYKVLKFDYDSQGDSVHTQYNKCIVGINNNHIMRINTSSGSVVNVKAYERSPKFTAVATDYVGNSIVGDETGGVKFFTDIGKKAVKCFGGCGDAITTIKAASNGDVVATTNYYFIYLPQFTRTGDIEHKVCKISPLILDYLNIHTPEYRNAQFSADECTIVFSIGKYMFHWDIDNIDDDNHEVRIYEADSEIKYHKIDGLQFAVTNKPISFNL